MHEKGRWEGENRIQNGVEEEEKWGRGTEILARDSWEEAALGVRAEAK